MKVRGEADPAKPLKTEPFRRANHYVPRLYLKRFAAADGRVFTYRVLTAHSRFPLWRATPIKGIAYHSHLYTRTIAGGESDELEKWLNSQFEAPAEEPLAKATSEMRLSTSDWHALIRFAAAQDVRTPARLHDNLQRWSKQVPGILDETLRDAVSRAEAARRAGQPLTTSRSYKTDLLPLRVTTAIEPGEKFGTIKSEILVGRGLWFFGIYHLLTETVEVLMTQKWTILLAPDGLSWFTSDDPVIRLNYESETRYDFGGGWGRKGCEIMLPLDARHLLYTKIGERPPERGAVIPRRHAIAIRRFIAEHAHRYIFAPAPDAEVSTLRPRIVDEGAIRREQELWNKWHEEQAAAERELLDSRSR